jgi:steroid 5-alpha reductase family enzyme
MEKIKIDLENFEFIFLLLILFGIIISLSNTSDFINFPKNMTPYSWLGVILLIIGLYGVCKAEGR